MSIWSAVVLGVIWVAWGSAPAALALGLALAGGLGWSLFEYAMHRWMFHWQPVRPWLEALVFLIHGNHHAVPNDRLRNMMPLVVSMPIAGVIWAGCVWLLGAAGSWAFLGFIIGYVGYDLTHYACHQWPMKGRLGRLLKQHHMRHHHARSPGNFAITGIMWDQLFRTRIVSMRAHVEANV